MTFRNKFINPYEGIKHDSPHTLYGESIMKNMYKMCMLCSLAIINLFGCSSVPKTEEARNVLEAETIEAVAIFKSQDHGIQKFFDTSYGYAVFPKVYKGAFWVGGAYGKGQVYRQSQMTGYSSMSQATLGFSFGGEYFREIVFFSTKKEYDEFCSDEFAFSAQVTAVAVTEGAALKANYENGVVVFIIAQKGLMVDVSVGGQKFEFTPMSLVK